MLDSQSKKKHIKLHVKEGEVITIIKSVTGGHLEFVFHNGVFIITHNYENELSEEASESCELPYADVVEFVMEH